MEYSLHSPQATDAWFWQQLRTQPSTQRFNPPGTGPSLENLRKQIEQSNRPFADKQTMHRFFMKDALGNFRGIVALRGIDWEMGSAEIGYLIEEAAHNQGLGTIAVSLMVKKAFDETDLRKIKAITLKANGASGRVLEKNGFVVEGLLKEEYIIQGNIEDAVLWAKLRS